MDDVRNRVRDQVQGEVRDLIQDEIRARVRDQVRDQVRDGIRDEAGGVTHTTDPPVADLSTRDLAAQITELAGHLNAANHRWLVLIA